MPTPRKVLIHGTSFFLLRKSQDGVIQFQSEETAEMLHFGGSMLADLYSAGLLILDPMDRVYPVEGEH
jgi:hypothetical protein